MYIFGLLIPILLFSLEVWPRIINRYFGIDTWRHLMYANYIRTHKRLPTSITDRYLIISPYGYPPAILIFLALFPKRFTERYQFIFSPLFDFIHNYLIFFATLFITHNLLAALIAQTIVALIPVSIIEASNLNTRVLSYLVFTSSFFPLLLFVTTNSYIWLAIAFSMLYLLFFTHRFALQMYLFGVVGFSIIEKNPFYILFFLFTFIFVYVTGRKIYKAILAEHLGILTFWRKNYPLRFAHQFRGIPKKNDYYDFVQKVYLLSTKSPIIYILGNNPWIILFVTFLIGAYFNVFSSSMIFEYAMVTKLVIWTMLSFLAATLTLCFKQLYFIGEGHRYLEYGIFPMSIVLGIFFAFFIKILGLYVVLSMVLLFVVMLGGIIFIQIKTILRDRSRTITSGLWEIIEYLNKKDGTNVRLVVFPFTLTDALVYFLKGRLLATDSGKGLVLLRDIFPIIRLPFPEVIRKYNLNYILFDENYVTLKELKLKKYTIVKHIEGYYLLKV